MLQIVYIALFMLFAPRYIFSFYSTKSARITFKEVLTHGVVFGFTVMVAQFISKRYGVFEGFANDFPKLEEVKSVPPLSAPKPLPDVQKGTTGRSTPSVPAPCPKCPQITPKTTLGELCTTYSNK